MSNFITTTDKKGNVVTKGDDVHVEAPHMTDDWNRPFFGSVKDIYDDVILVQSVEGEEFSVESDRVILILEFC